MRYFCFLWLVTSALGIPAMAQNRMPEIPPDKWSAVQQKAVKEFIAKRGKPPGHTGPSLGPYVPLLRSPDVMLSVEAMGQYLQFKTVLPPKLREFVILISARQWTQATVWNTHVSLAVKEGLSPEIAKALAEGSRPVGMSYDEETVYEFCNELDHNKSVSDPTYARALVKFGEQGIIDMVGVYAYYNLLEMVMNVARTPPPPPVGSLPTITPFPK